MEFSGEGIIEAESRAGTGGLPSYERNAFDPVM
jgi:hypothetical protein